MQAQTKATNTEKPLMLRLPQALKVLNLSRALYYLIRANKDGRFSHLPPLPPVVKVSAKVVMLRTADVEQWAADVMDTATPVQIDAAMRDIVRLDQ